MSSILKKSLIVLMYFLVAPSASPAITIDLNQQDIFVRKGFDKTWTNTLPSKHDTNWIHVPGKTGSRPLVVRELGFEGLPNRSFLSIKTFPAESFTFVTSFNIASSDIDNLPHLSLFLKGIGYNWEIFLNGISIEKEICFNINGEMSPRRGHKLLIFIPSNLIRVGENTLSYHIIGDPTHFGTGFYYGEPYTISSTVEFFPPKLNLFSLTHFVLYIVIAITWLYFFIRQRQHLFFLYFSLLSFAFAVYSAERALVEISSGTFNFLSFKVEYLSIFSIALMFALVVNTYLKHKITLTTKVYCFFCGLFIFLAVWAPPNFILDVLRVWQFTLPFMAGYLLYLSIGCLLANYKAQTKSIALPNYWKEILVKEITFFSLCVSILLGTVIIDMLDSVFWRKALFVNKYGFLICMIGIAGLLFNRFIRASERVEKWSEELEKEVQDKTQNLRALKDDLEAVFLALPDLYFRIDQNGQYLEYRGPEDQLYKPKDNIVGSTVSERLPKTTAKKIMYAIQVVVSQQKRVTVEYELDMPNGTRIFEAAMLPFHRDEVIAGVRDITDRRIVEESLLKSNEQYRSLVENMEDIVLVIDPNHKILFVNQSLLILNSKKTSAVLGHNISTHLTEKGTPVIAETIDRIVKSLHGEKIDVEITFSTFSSWFEFSFVPQFDASNSLYSILCIGRDITEKIMYEQGLVQHVEKLQTQQHQLRKLSKEMLNIQEDERKYISMELHDEIGQSMTAINMTLQSIRTGELDDKKIKMRIADCQKLVEETSSKIHQFSMELRPPELDDLGLIPAIKSHSRKFTARTGLTVTIESDNEVENLGAEIKTAFYRVFQEGINNIAKHANASSINVSIHKQNGKFLCYIEDDGDGFDSSQIFANTAGLGLIGMSERIKSIGGHFDIQSNSGKGTRLCVELPKNRVER